MDDIGAIDWRSTPEQLVRAVINDDNKFEERERQFEEEYSGGYNEREFVRFMLSDEEYYEYVRLQLHFADDDATNLSSSSDTDTIDDGIGIEEEAERCPDEKSDTFTNVDMNDIGSFGESIIAGGDTDDAESPLQGMQVPSAGDDKDVDFGGGGGDVVDLFTQHTPHVTLYLADFALEDDDAQAELNQTKVEAFTNAISSINFTEIIAGVNCPLSFANDQSTSAYYKINGAFTMLPIENTQCLQALSEKLVYTLQPYLRRPIIVPSWVASLPEPARSAAIYRCRTWGSPNVFEEFEPHVTVGYDPISSYVAHATTKWRDDAMKQWNEAYVQVCIDEVQGIALGKTGVGGTVLAKTQMGYWKFRGKPNSDGLPLIAIRNENTHVDLNVGA